MQWRSEEGCFGCSNTPPLGHIHANNVCLNLFISNKNISKTKIKTSSKKNPGYAPDQMYKYYRKPLRGTVQLTH